MTKPFDDFTINITFQRPTYGGLPSYFEVYYRPRGKHNQAPMVKTQNFPQRAWILVTGLDFLVYDFWTVGVNDLGQSEISDVTEQQPIRKLSKSSLLMPINNTNLSWRSFTSEADSCFNYTIDYILLRIVIINT